ncbi:hypothetical protein MTO96_045484, partial [Rhipicephalus appendiculatus]
MKVTRIDMSTVRRYLLDGPPEIAEALSVVHLVRDPRAIWLSRQHRNFCIPVPDCSSATVLCDEIERDMDVFNKVSREFPGRVIQRCPPRVPDRPVFDGKNDGSQDPKVLSQGQGLQHQLNRAWMRLRKPLPVVLLVAIVHILWYGPKHDNLEPFEITAVRSLQDTTAADGPYPRRVFDQVKSKNGTTSVDILKMLTPPTTPPERVTEGVLEASTLKRTTMVSKNTDTGTRGATGVGANSTVGYFRKHPAKDGARSHVYTTANTATSASGKHMTAELQKLFEHTNLRDETTKVRRILIVSYFRSGSSFLGQMLSANPRTFYHFEPLTTLAIVSRLRGEAALRALDYFTDFFSCAFANLSDHLQMAVEYPHWFSQNSYLRSVCKGVRRVCSNPEFLKALCKKAPTQ